LPALASARQTPVLADGNSKMEELLKHALTKEAGLGIFYVLAHLTDSWAKFVIPIMVLGGFITGFLLGRKQL
jgi:hypothetical protein